VVDRGKAHTTTVRGLYVYLERQTGLLRGSSNAEQRALAQQLQRYLEGYKEGWARPWIQQRLKAFSSHGPRYDLAFRPEVSGVERRQIRRAVGRAMRILRHSVAPRLLAALPPFRLRVGNEFPNPGIVVDPDGCKVITLRPETTLKDILHELGHEVGFHGGLRPLAMAHAIVGGRAFGTPAQPLRHLIPNTTYTDQQTAYEGGYLKPYVGRRYEDGFTEAISVGLEHLESPTRAMGLFQQDGEHLLLLLKALQPGHRYP